jgi:hypothetical protein
MPDLDINPLARYWKIVETDNMGSDYPDEKFIQPIPSMNKAQAEKVCDAINDVLPEHSRRYYKVVHKSYVLQGGFEP